MADALKELEDWLLGQITAIESEMRDLETEMDTDRAVGRLKTYREVLTRLRALSSKV